MKFSVKFLSLTLSLLIAAMPLCGCTLIDEDYEHDYERDDDDRDSHKDKRPSDQADQPSEEEITAWFATDWTTHERSGEQSQLTFFPDYTCVINGVSCTWEYVTTPQSFDYIEVHVTGEEGIDFSFTAMRHAEMNYGFFCYYDTAGRIQSISVRNQDFTAIEITSDNWQDYFTLELTAQYERNQYGQILSLTLVPQLICTVDSDLMFGDFTYIKASAEWKFVERKLTVNSSIPEYTIDYDSPATATRTATSELYMNFHFAEGDLLQISGKISLDTDQISTIMITKNAFEGAMIELPEITNMIVECGQLYLVTPKA